MSVQVKQKITIDDIYYFTMDGRSMSLYRKGVDDPIGYFTQLPPMVKRVIQLRADERVKDAGRDFSMTEYLDILIDEREHIEAVLRRYAPGRAT